ncbi:MAG: amidohydrolase family protein, partial [Acidobacteria bacterium]|nr:amidohydrolase family protein [Acidobacteriota bacterium]
MFKIRRFAAYVLVVSPPLIRTVALVGCLLCSVSTRGMAQGVDLIVLNGKIYTVDEKPLFQKGSSPTAGRVFEAMAIRNDTITALGTNEEILKLAAPDTKRLDVQGRVVLPGLIDSHSHQTGFLLEDFPELTVVRIPPSADKGEVRKQIEEAIRKKVQETKPGSWIVVRPIGDAARELILFTEITRADLDRWAPNNPVELNETGSGANSQIVINTKAREIAERELPGLKKLSDHDLKGDGVMLDKNILQDILLQGREQDYSKSLKKLLIAGLSTGTTT